MPNGEHGDAGRSSRSPNWGAPILFVLLLTFAGTHLGTFWGYLWQALFFALVAVGAYTAFAPSEFANERRRDPALTFTMHFVMTGIPYVILPLIGWVIVVPLRILAGAFVPALPWVALLLLAAVAIATGKVEREEPK